MTRDELRFGNECKNCVYWNPTEKTKYGECVRFPPAVSGGVTKQNHWCGEHKKG